LATESLLKWSPNRDGNTPESPQKQQLFGLGLAFVGSPRNRGCRTTNKDSTGDWLAIQRASAIKTEPGR
jgi:hypothetical protein